MSLSYDVASESEITPCNKIDYHIFKTLFAVIAESLHMR